MASLNVLWDLHALNILQWVGFVIFGMFPAQQSMKAYLLRCSTVNVSSTYTEELVFNLIGADFLSQVHAYKTTILMQSHWSRKVWLLFYKIVIIIVIKLMFFSPQNCHCILFPQTILFWLSSAFTGTLFQSTILSLWLMTLYLTKWDGKLKAWVWHD